MRIFHLGQFHLDELYCKQRRSRPMVIWYEIGTFYRHTRIQRTERIRTVREPIFFCTERTFLRANCACVSKPSRCSSGGSRLQSTHSNDVRSPSEHSRPAIQAQIHRKHVRTQVKYTGFTHSSMRNGERASRIVSHIEVRVNTYLRTRGWPFTYVRVPIRVHVRSYVYTYICYSRKKYRLAG